MAQIRDLTFRVGPVYLTRIKPSKKRHSPKESAWVKAYGLAVYSKGNKGYEGIAAMFWDTNEIFVYNDTDVRDFERFNASRSKGEWLHNNLDISNYEVYNG